MKDILKWVVFGGLFLVPFLTLYVENDYFFPFITGKNFWFRIIVDLTLVAYIGLALYEPKYRPRWSWVLGGAGAVLVVMFFANLLGQHPSSSFWSNYERMDGYVSLVHMVLYMVVLGSVLKTKTEWRWFLNTSLVVASLVAIGGLAQYFTVPSITQLFGINPNLSRLDSTLGNAAYMAVYMLFHMFIAMWLLIQSKSVTQILTYLALLPMFAFVLIETGTRGTAIGLVVGAFVMVSYITLFAKNHPDIRRIASGVLVAIAVVVGGFIAIKDTDLIQDQPNLARIANISLDDLEIRSIIWGMAWQGVQERPLLGWGQSNFNYVFNEHYDPRLYAQEQWFDRAHNIFMDWLIAGGFLGLIAYLSIFAACIYYLAIRPLLDKNDGAFSVMERGVLLGLLAGYFTHNLVVFDNIVSYIFFAVILALIHSRVATPIKRIADKKIDEQLITQAYLPAGAFVLGMVMLFVHMPGMAAAGDIIDAFRAVQPSVINAVQRPPAGPAVMLEEFQSALDRGSFGQQEITEQIAQQSMGMFGNAQVPSEVQAAFASTSERELETLVERKPDDARIHVFIASYYRATGQIDRAAQEMATARALSPDKQSIIHQQGFIELARGQNGAARDFFEQAFVLDESYVTAREYFAASLLYVGQTTQAMALMTTDDIRTRFANSEFLIGAAQQASAQEFLVELYRQRTEIESENPQNWATLAFLYFELGDSALATETLTAAAEMIPSFAPTAGCIAANIESGSATPQEGC